MRWRWKQPEREQVLAPGLGAQRLRRLALRLLLHLRLRAPRVLAGAPELRPHGQRAEHLRLPAHRLLAGATELRPDRQQPQLPRPREVRARRLAFFVVAF